MASAPPPPYSPPASPLVESKKDLRGTLPLNIIFFDIPTPITITENNSREWVKALRDFAYSSVHHDQLAKVLGRVLGEAWDRLDAESRPRRRPACEDVVNYLRQSFPELHGAFLLFQCSEDRLSFDLRRDHAFFIEDPSRPGSAYVLPDDVLTDWANDVVEDLSNNCILRKPAIDFSTATPAPPPPPGYIRCRLAQVFDPRPPRPAGPAGPPPQGYTRMAIGGMCRRGPVGAAAGAGGAGLVVKTRATSTFP
ncbi:hypothetical protein NBRC10513v2_002087 [Rhodotorula toruloides]